jgi:prepilin-type N-terminal cleavage/methylation domain-containing protein
MVDKIMSKIQYRGRRGFSLLELLVVITVITLLAAAMVTVGNHVQLNAKIKNTKMTITLLNNALEEYKAFKDTGSGDDVWPVSIDAFTPGSSFADKLEYRLAGFLNQLPLPLLPPDFEFKGGDHDAMGWDTDSMYALDNIEFVYYCLDDVPKCHEILNRSADQAKSNNDKDSMVAYGQEKTLIEVNDAWGHPILYEHVFGSGNVPVLTSAGEDGVFGNADDIISSEF